MLRAGGDPPPPPPPSGSFPALIDINSVSTTTPGKSMPAFGGSFTETFGTRVWRITSSNNEFHHYGKNQSHNRSGALISLGLNLIRNATPPFAHRHTAQDGSSRARRRWSNTDPNIIYATGGSTDNDHQLFWYNVISNSLVSLRSFGFNQVDIGVSEGNLTDNDKWVVLGARNGSGTDPWTNMILYDIETDTIIGTRAVPSGSMDWCGISRLGGFVVWKDKPAGPHWVVPRSTFTSATPVNIGIANPSHPDFGVDNSGNEYYVGVDNSANAIRGRNLTAGTLHTFLQWPSSLSGHVSGRNYLLPNWMYFTARKHSSAARDVVVSFQLSPIISPQCRVWCHTREDAALSGVDVAGCPTPDGTGLVFRSRMGGTGAVETQQSFLVRVST